jgi:hypothetical protein
MDNEEAKFILQAHRPHGQDVDDPRVVAALEHARRDPELSRWLAAETAFDRAMTEKLAECRPPAGLKETILAGGKLVRPVVFWRRPAVLAIAACFAVLFLVTLLTPPDKAQAKSLDEFAAEYVATLTRLGHKGESLDELRPFLKGREVVVPVGLAGVPTMGCCEGSYQGKNFSIICFKAVGDGLRPEVHLLVFDSKDLSDLPDRREAMMSQQGDWALACWSKGGLSYVMARVGNKESLKKLL